MQIIECEEREGALPAALVDVWERSVRATHAFLSAQEILAIREFVPQALSGVERLVVALEGGWRCSFWRRKRGGAAWGGSCWRRRSRATVSRS